MSRWAFPRAVMVALAFLLVGCSDPQGGFVPNGMLQIDIDAEALEGEAPLNAAEGDAATGRLADDAESRDEPRQDRNWGRDRRMPSDSMPSRSGNWGSDRQRSSESTPSQSSPEPSFREPLPSESPTFRKPLPSESRPSNSFRKPLPSESNRSFRRPLPSESSR